jgi:outer membrane protein assembly factor BamB
MRGRISRTSLLGSSLLALALLSGCAEGPSLPKLGELNPFAEKAVPLPGKRIPVMQQKDTVTGELADASTPIMLPAAYANQDWSQPGGAPSNAPGHLAFSGAASEAWRVDAGTGSGSAGRVTASPIVYGDRVYVLDAEGSVAAFSTGGGQAIWRGSLKPDRENASGSWYSLGGGGSEQGGYGGGLAIDQGILYAASGFGNVVALDPASGKKLWERQLEAPVRASPTAAQGKVFVVTLDGRFYCLAGADGGILWSARGLPQQASLINNASPAVEGGIVVVPYPSGDLVALNAADGSAAWSENLARTRTTSQITSMSDAARPAIAEGVVFAVGHAGRMIATNAQTGERMWSLNVPGIQAPWVAGQNVFVVDTSGQLLAISKPSGQVLWTIKLPEPTWAGPVLAGGTLWLASAKGSLIGIDAASGRTTVQKSMGEPVYIAPVVAQGRMYILTDEAELIALN